MEEVGLLGTDTPVIGLTFRSGGTHFAAKALEFVPRDFTVMVVGTGLTKAEIDFLSFHHLTFSVDGSFDNELVYEMLMENTSGTFGWVDADCFVINPNVWDELLAPMSADVMSHAAFTYQPLGFARTPLVVWRNKARSVLVHEGTTLNSYALEPTNVGRAAPHAISRLVQDRHRRHLECVLGVGPDGDLLPHEGLLDVYDNKRTVNSIRRSDVAGWFGPDVTRVGWLIDTPMMAEIVLRANGYKTRRLIDSNIQVGDDIIHVGASSYRERMRNEGAGNAYLARFRLTDLFEVLLAKESVQRGLDSTYAELAEAQEKRLSDDAGIHPDDIKSTACEMLRADGVDVHSLTDDPRMRFLF